MISAATDLFQANSLEVIAVTNAWHAVGVGNRHAPVIMGPDVIGASCSATYTVVSLPPGVTSGNWQVLGGSGSGSGLTYSSTTGTSFTVTRSSGVNDPQYATLRFTFASTNVDRVIIARILPVFAGMREAPTSPLMLAARVGYPVYFQAGLPSNQRPLVQQYQWELTAGGLVYHFDGELTTSTHTFTTAGTYLLRLRVRDGCGWSRWLDFYVDAM